MKQIDSSLVIRPEDLIVIQPDKKGGPGSGNLGHAGRPGERGGSGPGSGVNPKVLKLVESEIRQNDFETAVVFAPDGHELLRQANPSQSNEVKFSEKQISDLRKNAGATLTHNHPLLAFGGSTSFSPNDIGFAHRCLLAEMRASAHDGYDYSMKPPEGQAHFLAEGWSRKVYSEAKDVILHPTHEMELNHQKFREGHLTDADYQRNALHLFWAEVAARTGMRYTQTKRG